VRGLTAVVLSCLVLWNYPLTVESPMEKAVQGTLELRACEGSNTLSRPLSQPVLEVWRVLRFTDGSFIGETMEVRLPWGAHEPLK
jgi:hypothetical protein